MTTTQPTEYVLFDLVSGRYLPGRFSFDEATAAAGPLTEVRRLDEALEAR